MDQHPDQDFRARVDAIFAQVVAGLAESGQQPHDADVNMEVTGRTDAEVAFIQHRATEMGFGAMQFVDDAPAPRPGTVSSATLSPLASSAVAEARAKRLLNNQNS